jgi:alanine racemase
MTARLAETIVDLTAIRSNAALLKERSAPGQMMAVVKADAYGHGLLPVARAAVDGGASWLGVALLSEALELRAGGVTTPVLAWLHGPGEAFDEAIRHDIDVTVAARWALAEVVAAARSVGRTARVQLKVDTGLGRGGSTADSWVDLVEHARKAEVDGAIEVSGIWSHLAYADAPGHPTIDRQLGAFHAALDVAQRAGLRPQVRHLANSAATLTRPDTHFDLTRPGLALYGLSPIPGQSSASGLGLRPAMSLTARLILVKRVPAGQGVSYQHRYVTAKETTLGLVPLGYADGIPRNATNVGPVLVAGRRRTIAGTVCMDQFVVDLGDDTATEGDEVWVFGPGDHEEPTVDDWAKALDTISYEIVTRIGPRVERRYVTSPTGSGR